MTTTDFKILCVVVIGFIAAWWILWWIADAVRAAWVWLCERNKVRPNPPTEEEVAVWRAELEKLPTELVPGLKPEEVGVERRGRF